MAAKRNAGTAKNSVAIERANRQAVSSNPRFSRCRAIIRLLKAVARCNLGASQAVLGVHLGKLDSLMRDAGVH